MIFSEKAKSNNAFYYEVCMLKLLSDMGYLNEKDLKHLFELPYTKLAYEIINRYQDGIPSNDLMAIIQKSYAKYDTVNMIPVRKAAGMRIAELYHGPTYSFKDVALQFLGNLFEYILTKKGVMMVTATLRNILVQKQKV